MDYQEIEDQIQVCYRGMAHLRDRIQELRALTSHPVVLPVLHWMEYHEPMSETYSDHPDQTGDLLREAYGVVRAMAENGQASPSGVSIGGVFLSCEELAEIYPDVGY